MEDIALAALPREIESEGESDGDTDDSVGSSFVSSKAMLPLAKGSDDPIMQAEERSKVVADILDQL